MNGPYIIPIATITCGVDEKKIRADERAKVINEIINNAYESKTGFLTIRKGFLIELKEVQDNV